MLKQFFIYINKMQFFFYELGSMQQTKIFFFKAMFGKNLFFSKTKTVKIGLGDVCQTHP
jgi:hypothetical protein